MKSAVFRIWLLLLPLLLASCAGYEAIPWRESQGRADTLRALGERLAAGLDVGARESNVNLNNIRARNASGKDGEQAFRVVVAGFPEARTGVRTTFSRQVEEAVRRALHRSKYFQVIDGGEGIAWQEATLPRPGAAPADPRQAEEDDEIGSFEVVPLGEWRAEARRRESQGQDASPAAFSRELDGDHPFQGLWPQALGGAYGENSAIYAASIFGADAAVLGAYALGPDRVRVWAAVVLNTPPRFIYYARGLKDVFGLPERLEVSRVYAAYARDALPRSAVPDEILAARTAPRSRELPSHPPFWGEPALRILLEEIDDQGQRQRLTVRNMLGAKSLVVGRLAARGTRHVYAFALNKEGEAEEIFSSSDPERQGWSRRVEPGRFFPFTARLIGVGRIYRLYFVSAPAPFEGSEAVRAARKRLGMDEKTRFRNARAVAGGNPPTPWFVPGGQDHLILKRGWDQQVFWLFRQGPR